MECTIKAYIESKKSLDSKIAAFEELIDAMLLTTLEAIENSGTASYSLDDGQTKIMTQYRSMEEVMKGVRNLEKTKQIYVNRRNGSLTILRGRLKY